MIGPKDHPISKHTEAAFFVCLFVDCVSISGIAFGTRADPLLPGSCLLPAKGVMFKKKERKSSARPRDASAKVGC